MAQAIRLNSPLFTEAVLLWTAYGHDFMPRHDDAAVIARFGEATATELLATIKAVMDEFYKSDAMHTASDLVAMGQQATDQFKTKHPEVDDEILKALAWCYTFDFK